MFLVAGQPRRTAGVVVGVGLQASVPKTGLADRQLLGQRVDRLTALTGQFDGSTAELRRGGAGTGGSSPWPRPPQDRCPVTGFKLRPRTGTARRCAPQRLPPVGPRQQRLRRGEHHHHHQQQRHGHCAHQGPRPPARGHRARRRIYHPEAAKLRPANPAECGEKYFKLVLIQTDRKSVKAVVGQRPLSEDGGAHTEEVVSWPRILGGDPGARHHVPPMVHA
jgi:hypothetical protein